jgi:hypothetical protein
MVKHIALVVGGNFLVNKLFVESDLLPFDYNGDLNTRGVI